MKILAQERQGEPWPFTDTATVAAALLVWFWVGVLCGWLGTKGGVL